MSGIVGIAQSGKSNEVEKMLDKIAHRGPAGREVVELDSATFGIVYTKIQKVSADNIKKEKTVRDAASDGHCAQAQLTDKGLVLQRDELGVAPLYYGQTDDGALCFASEVKALLGLAKNIKQLPAGHRYDGQNLEQFFKLEKKPILKDSPEVIAKELRKRIDASVKKRISNSEICGSWLSGGLDSSTLVALARPYVKTLHTFAAGMKGAPDLDHAKEVADFIKSDHHEVVVTLEDMLAALPEAIYNLESFDALLIRSSVNNYLVAKKASEYVPEVFSGESGDELFAGYSYLKDMKLEELPDELIDITNRLQNTAFQRVDRSASGNGTVAHVALADPAVIDYALRIPIEYKLRDGEEKWILRRAIDPSLPARALKRPKAKFWEGAGVQNILSDYAEKKISDADFKKERNLSNGWVINTKEELMYYRIFKESFGELEDLSWMGRTKGAPKS
ncbi:MAG: asparagine synthase [Planctomycetes bacterium]|nr:asparagine synthase [Planctomycetota bacterium]